MGEPAPCNLHLFSFLWDIFGNYFKLLKEHSTWRKGWSSRDWAEGTKSQESDLRFQELHWPISASFTKQYNPLTLQVVGRQGHPSQANSLSLALFLCPSPQVTTLRDHCSQLFWASGEQENAFFHQTILCFSSFLLSFGTWKGTFWFKDKCSPKVNLPRCGHECFCPSHARSDLIRCLGPMRVCGALLGFIGPAEFHIPLLD